MTEAEWLACDDPVPMMQCLLGEPVVEEVSFPDMGVTEVQTFPHCRGSDRRRRLFLCACCRAVDPDLTSSPVLRAAVEATERYFDGAATTGEVTAASGRLSAEASASRADLVPVAPARVGWGALFTRLVRLVAGSPALPPLPSPPDQSSRLRDALRRYTTLHLGELASQIDWGDSAVWGIGWVTGTLQHGPTEESRHEMNARLAVHCRDVFGNPFRPIAADPAWLTFDVLALARGIYAERAFDRLPILADALQDAGCASEDVLNHCRDTNISHVRGCWVVDVVLGKA